MFFLSEFAFFRTLSFSQDKDGKIVVKELPQKLGLATNPLDRHVQQ